MGRQAAGRQHRGRGPRRRRRSPGTPGEAVRNMVAAYRRRMAQLATMAPLEVWYERIDVDAVLALARKQQMSSLPARSSAWWQQRSPPHQPGGAAEADRAGRRAASDHRGSAAHPARRAPSSTCPRQVIEAYVESLSPERRALLERYRMVDAARKVVGVGSVGHPLLRGAADGRRRRLAAVPPGEGSRGRRCSPATRVRRSSGTRASGS